MGIDTQVRAPVVREPIDLFFDPAYASAGSNGGADNGCLADSSSVPMIVTARLAPGQDRVSDGTLVFILSPEAGTATIWVAHPAPRRLGHVIGPGAQQVARACRAAVQALTGTVVAGVAEGQADELRVRLHGT